MTPERSTGDVREEGQAARRRWSIPVTTSSSSYRVIVGPGVLGDLAALLTESAPAHRYAVIADDRVFALHGAALERSLSGLARPPVVHTFPAGEPSKSREQWARLTDLLLANGLGRDACLIALGGGVAGDLVGFVASTYMRGIPVVQIPTSLVAMVDASVGGTTGVDVPLGKNLVGAFHPPAFVLADTDLSVTLSRDERAQGLAEAVKHGAILDATYLGHIEADADALMDGDPGATAEIVARSVELKAGVVSKDEREAGFRQILNFGHTLGHALEAASGLRLPHGSAVAVGMVLEAELGERLGITETGVAERLTGILARMGLPTRIPNPDVFDVDDIVALTMRDKKARGGAVRYVLLSRLGAVAHTEGWSTRVEEAPVRDLLREAVAL
jgi:3-dehydroquinate synthase